jgi:hypothetical protein
VVPSFAFGIVCSSKGGPQVFSLPPLRQLCLVRTGFLLKKESQMQSVRSLEVNTLDDECGTFGGH